MGARSNPFSACFVKPGAIPWLARAGAPSLDSLASTVLASAGLLNDTPCTFEIVGPHGVGKTTLLIHLAAHFERHCGLSTLLVRGSKFSPRWFVHLVRRPDVLLVDESARLPLSARLLLRAFPPSRFVIRAVHIASPQARVLARLEPTPELIDALADHVSPGSQLSERLRRERKLSDNPRAALFEMYDAVERMSTVRQSSRSLMS